ncbi:UNVERIFIED_CONTAM: hypothetical protein NCL1_57748, partial [Trichonephila clavipes]
MSVMQLICYLLRCTNIFECITHRHGSSPSPLAVSTSSGVCMIPTLTSLQFTFSKFLPQLSIGRHDSFISIEFGITVAFLSVKLYPSPLFINDKLKILQIAIEMIFSSDRLN